MLVLCDFGKKFFDRPLMKGGEAGNFEVPLQITIIHDWRIEKNLINST